MTIGHDQVREKISPKLRDALLQAVVDVSFLLEMLGSYMVAEKADDLDFYLQRLFEELDTLSAICTASRIGTLDYSVVRKVLLPNQAAAVSAGTSSSPAFN